MANQVSLFSENVAPDLFLINPFFQKESDDSGGMRIAKVLIPGNSQFLLKVWF